MSSILKALKKLEEEKSRLEEPKEINVSREILKQPPANRNMLKWLWLLGSTAALVIIILTLALIRQPATKEVVKFSEMPLASQPAVPHSPVQKLLVSPQLSGSAKEARPITPQLSNEPKQKPSGQSPDPQDEHSIRKENVALPGGSAPAVGPKKTETALKTAPLQTAPLQKPVTGETAFTLTGIAWNKDSADRLAIINGEPAATGATVNGVIVEEILPDRVKLSRNGLIFELLIGKSIK